MTFNKPNANWFVPDQIDFDAAVKRTTHMAIGAHQDDLEIMALDGILKCYHQENRWFFGVVVTDGAGSARGGKYRQLTDEDMKKIRVEEQKKAAQLGEYGAMVQLGYQSTEAKDPHQKQIVDELKALILQAKPEVIYTHNPADKHDTHIGVLDKVLKAIRKLDYEDRPKAFYGCEVWRALDWLNDDEKIIFDLSERPHLGMALVEIFDSQIDGSKRYDLATIGRRQANATYSVAHDSDDVSLANYAIDLTPLIKDDDLDLKTFITDAIKRFKKDVADKIERLTKS